MTSALLDEVRLGARAAPSRVLFGPHVTNLSRRRTISAGHAAYYERRARGGAGVVVTEIASVHESDWPYERAPLAAECGRGWRAVADACRPHGAIVLAGLGHAGMQGSTSWSQDVLWAPSLVPNVMTREQPVAMGEAEIAALVEGFALAARDARDAGCDGVELNAGQHSLLRQFCSGLTNLRDDRFGVDRTLVLREVICAVRAALDDGVLGLRFSADELAPWAGITPEEGCRLLAAVAGDLDYVCVVRGSIYSEAATQPDGHEPQGFNVPLATQAREALRAAGHDAVVCAQGSIADVAVAEGAVSGGSLELVEMTRAQIADPDLVGKLRRARGERIRPCLLCNQHCLVRDVRNPIVSCAVNPMAGHELDDAALDDAALDSTRAHGASHSVLVVGGGIAGLEAARLLGADGSTVTVRDRAGALGGALLDAAALPGRERLAALATWLVDEARREGVTIETGVQVDAAAMGGFDDVVVATGALPPSTVLRDGTDGSVQVVSAEEVARGWRPSGDAVVLDPVGGPLGVGTCELLVAGGGTVALVSGDVVAGSQLAASGDLVAANGRLASLGVETILHATVIAIAHGEVVIEDRFTGEVVRRGTTVLVDAGHRRAVEAWWPETAKAIGDAVAPRGILSAMLEARQLAARISGSSR